MSGCAHWCRLPMGMGGSNCIGCKTCKYCEKCGRYPPEGANLKELIDALPDVNPEPIILRGPGFKK